MVKVKEPLILFEVEVIEKQEFMLEDVFLPEPSEEEEEEILLVDEDLVTSDTRRRTSMEHPSRLNGWRQTDFK